MTDAASADALDDSGLAQKSDVVLDGCGAQVQPFGQHCRGHRSILSHGLDDGLAGRVVFLSQSLSQSLILKNAVENHFTAKQQRAQRTYSKNKSHPFGEAIDHLNFDSNLCFSLHLCVFAVEI